MDRKEENQNFKEEQRRRLIEFFLYLHLFSHSFTLIFLHICKAFTPVKLCKAVEIIFLLYVIHNYIAVFPVISKILA